MKKHCLFATAAVLTLTLAFIIAVAVVDDVAASTLGVSDENALLIRRTACPVIIVGTTWLLIRSLKARHSLVRIDRSPGEPIHPEISIAARDATRVALKSEYGTQEGLPILGFLRDLLTGSDTYIERVFEDVEIQHLTLTINTSVHIATPYGASETRFLFPTIWVEKGALVSNFTIRDRDKKPLPVLPQIKTKAILSVLVDQLLRLAYFQGRPASGSITAQAAQRLVSECAWRTGMLRERQVERILDRLASRTHLTPGMPETILHETLKRLCTLLAGHYVLITEAKSQNGHTIVECSRTVPLLRELGPPTTKGHLRRVLLGARPDKVSLPLEWPFRASSYHFRLEGEAGEYVTATYLMTIGANERILRNEIPAGAADYPQIRTEEPSGLPYAHLYLRRFSLFTDQRARIGTTIEFMEVPPGVLGATVLLSGAIAFLVGAFTWFYPHYISPSSLPTFPAFLLAFLAVVPSWLGFTSDRDSILRAPLISRLGLFTVSVLSVASALLYALSPHLDWPPWNLSFFGQGLHEFNGWWFTLTCVSIFNFSFLLAIFITRVRSYTKDLNRNG
ncbi:hypothetical protein [Streptomyces sp. NBC_00239]|uniref:hypothetical protein n=1 Tax=Streptomyces sp. NBC_00239 TaxID=2903640 RepID=UPI002E2E2109|nr:hypothetical protein [Streptomyces sp. NBC_00239]